MGSDHEHWDFVGYSSGSSVAFMPSPSTGSLSGYAIIGHHVGQQAAGSHRSLGSPSSAANRSPAFVDLDGVAMPTNSPYQSQQIFPDHSGVVAFTGTAPLLDPGFIVDPRGDQFMASSLMFEDFPVTSSAAQSMSSDGQGMMMSADFGFMDPFSQNMAAIQTMDMFGPLPTYQQQSPPMPYHHANIPMHPSPQQQSPSPISAHHEQQMGFNTFQMYQSTTSSQRQWTPPSPSVPASAPSQPAQSPIIIHESGYSTSPLLSSSCGSPYHSDSTSADVKPGSGKASPQASLRKVKAGKIEKKSSAVSSNSSNRSLESDKFVVLTPTTITASAGRTNLYEGPESTRTTQRGRKGPLADDTKESALQVRRRGACFWFVFPFFFRPLSLPCLHSSSSCKSRKVRCDMVRPCKNCVKLAMTVPQVMCWQFQDFMPVLFPPMMRAHFRKEKMAAFMAENLADIETHYTLNVELYSGPSFATVLRLPAKAFRPKNKSIMKHYHLYSVNRQIDMKEFNSAPLVLELETNAQRDALKKAAKEYVLAMTKEQCYVSQTTDSIKHTKVPHRILQIVQKYANDTDNAMVKKALAIYGSHYVMTRHLCLTQESSSELVRAKVIPGNVTVMTPRVAARQIKAVVDEILAKDMQTLFENFSKSLKPKSKREWAPCLASFLVLCLFIEAVELAAYNFVITSNEISMREHRVPEFERKQALKINTDVENLPFKQFAYQFHQIYQTHSRDVSTRPYNPLVDDAQLDFSGIEHPKAALEMTKQLRDMIQPGEPCELTNPCIACGAVLITRFAGRELDFLSADPILKESNEAHPFPRDASLSYTGRLISRFLLSFTDERYIFGDEKRA
jgi:hypothetical protein